MSETWRLVIITEHGTVSEMYGTEDVLRAFVDEWNERPMGDHILSVSGICESSDRAPKTLWIRADCIISVVLMKQWG